MRILGIDPGTLVMGFGVIEGEDDEIALIGYGTITGTSRTPIGERLSNIYNQLLDIIGRHHPDVVAIEEPFVAKNVRSALAIGRAQAVAMLAAANRHLPAYEYTPTQVKQRVSNYGAGSKEQVQEMVRLHLGLAEPPQPDDAADALAVAICHLHEMHLNDLISGKVQR